METALVWLGRLAAIAGTLVLVVAVGFRASGRYFVGDLQVGTLLNVAMAGLLFACVCFLAVLTGRGRK
jgi:hypothetical protein